MGDEEAFETWRRLEAAKGAEASIIALYELVAASRGTRAEKLSPGERQQLALRALHAADPTFHITAGSERADDPIELAPYDPRWAEMFAGWKRSLRGGLGETAVLIEHVGSTAVPGLAAKPVIDVQVSVIRPQDEDAYVPVIEALGVQLRNSDAEHHFFRPPEGRPRDVHVHVCATGSPWERRHLLFRDYLRADTWARDAYLAVKVEAVGRWSDDRVAYTEAKGGVIRRLTSDAEAWAVRTGWQVPG